MTKIQQRGREINNNIWTLLKQKPSHSRREHSSLNSILSLSSPSVDSVSYSTSSPRLILSPEIIMSSSGSISRFPVPHKNLSLEIKGNQTNLIICSYDDHLLVIATQIGTMGTILRARKEETVLTEPTFDVSVILGKRDEPMLVACARQLIEHISSNSSSSKPLILSLGLKDHSAETLKCIVSAVIENRLW